MPSLQEWIHKMEEGSWVRYIRLAAGLLGLLALTAIYDIREFKNFSTQEAMDSAQLARNIAEGKGYTTDFIRPLSILLTQRLSPPGIPVLKEPHPDLANPPVYPFFLAGWMKVLPFHFETKAPFGSYQPEVLIALCNQLVFFCAILLVYRLALRLFDVAVAWVSVIVFTGADLLWRFSISGLSTMLLILLFLLIVWCLVSMEANQREEKRSHAWFVLMAVFAGCLTGIGGLTRYSFMVLIVPVAGFFALFFGSRRWVLMASAFAACVLVVSPWIVRNYKVSHAPFGTAGYSIYQDTESFPGNRVERYLGADLETELARIGPGGIGRKFAGKVAKIVSDDLPRLGGNWLAGFFLVSLLIPFRNPGLSRLRIFTVMSLVVLIAAQALSGTHLEADSPVVNSENLLVIAAPAVFIFGVGLFFVLLDQIEFTFVPLRTLASLVFSMIMCLPLILTLLPPRGYTPAWPPYWPPRIREVGRWMGSGELMMSDMPWAVAWYGGRQCVWVTLDAPSDSAASGKSDFFAIYDFQKPITGIYLTQLSSNADIFSAMPNSPEVAWGDFMLRSIFKNTIPNGFPLKVAHPHFVEEGQLFLSDRERWRQTSR